MAIINDITVGLLLPYISSAGSEASLERRPAPTKVMEKEMPRGPSSKTHVFRFLVKLYTHVKTP